MKFLRVAFEIRDDPAHAETRKARKNPGLSEERLKGLEP
jgi:hypothetical protein